MPKFRDWLKSEELLNEDTRYSVEVNFRTTTDEAMDQIAKMTLGYVSAALKKADMHVRHVFEEKPLRILISSRNWDDGEWVGVVSWNPNKKCYIISSGNYNKDRKTVSVKDSKDCKAENASQIVKEVKNLMHSLKNKKDLHKEKLKPAKIKTGPKS